MFLSIATATVLACGCRTLSIDQKEKSVKGPFNQELEGSWSTFVTDHGFGTSVLIANFEKSGQYTFVWAWSLPSTPQEDGSQPVLGMSERGKYHVQGDTLYLDPLESDSILARRCMIRLPRKDVLILTVDEFHTYNFMKSQRINEVKGP